MKLRILKRQFKPLSGLQALSSTTDLHFPVSSLLLPVEDFYPLDLPQDRSIPVECARTLASKTSARHFAGAFEFSLNPALQVDWTTVTRPISIDRVQNAWISTRNWMTQSGLSPAWLSSPQQLEWLCCCDTNVLYSDHLYAWILVFNGWLTPVVCLVRAIGLLLINLPFIGLLPHSLST